MAVMKIEVDDQLFLAVQKVAAKTCMNLPQAIHCFLERMVHDQRLPFTPLDPFYRPENLAELLRRIEDMKLHPEKLMPHDLIE